MFFWLLVVWEHCPACVFVFEYYEEYGVEFVGYFPIAVVDPVYSVFYAGDGCFRVLVWVKMHRAYGSRGVFKSDRLNLMLRTQGETKPIDDFFFKLKLCDLLAWIFFCYSNPFKL